MIRRREKNEVRREKVEIVMKQKKVDQRQKDLMNLVGGIKLVGLMSLCCLAGLGRVASSPFGQLQHRVLQNQPNSFGGHQQFRLRGMLDGDLEGANNENNANANQAQRASGAISLAANEDTYENEGGQLALDQPASMDTVSGAAAGPGSGSERSGEIQDDFSGQGESADNSHELPDRLIENHNSRLQAMHDLFDRRQLVGANNGHPQQQQAQAQAQQQQHPHHYQLQSSQELSPISIGLDPISGPGQPFGMPPPPFSAPNLDGPPKVSLSNADNLDQGLGPGLPFGLGPLPQLLGFQSPAQFDGPQRGDQSAHSNHHTALPSSDSETSASPKVWPKIFRFTDGRINLSDFEKQKKIRLSSKSQHGNENHIESAPIMFDGRQLKRKSFLILHGGIFS